MIQDGTEDGKRILSQGGSLYQTATYPTGTTLAISGCRPSRRVRGSRAWAARRLPAIAARQGVDWGVHLCWAALFVALLVVVALATIWFAMRNLCKALDEDGKRPPVRYLDDEE